MDKIHRHRLLRKLGLRSYLSQDHGQEFDATIEIAVNRVKIIGMKEWLQLAFTREVFCRALLLAVAGGAVITLFNDGNAILNGEMTFSGILKTALIFMLLYCVSTTSSVIAIQSARIETPHLRKNE